MPLDDDTPRQSYVWQYPGDDPGILQEYAAKCAFYSGMVCVVVPVNVHDRKVD